MKRLVVLGLFGFFPLLSLASGGLVPRASCEATANCRFSRASCSAEAPTTTPDQESDNGSIEVFCGRVGQQKFLTCSTSRRRWYSSGEGERIATRYVCCNHEGAALSTSLAPEAESQCAGY